MGTKIVRSFHPSSPIEFDFFPYQIIKAGHIETDPEYKISRKSIPGTELLFVLNGSGYISIHNQEYFVPQNSIVWLNVRKPFSHWPNPDEPWHLYWCRIDGNSLEQTSKVLGINESPVFSDCSPEITRNYFHELFNALEKSSLTSTAIISSVIGQLVEIMFKSRIARLKSVVEGFPIAEDLARFRAILLRTYNQHWNVEKMAMQFGVSSSQLYRICKKGLAMTPKRWLCTIRIAQASRRLIESNDTIGEIAYQVGYRDQYNFSKDFKKLTGFSPSKFRILENKGNVA